MLTIGIMVFLLLLNIFIFWCTTNLVYRYEKKRLYDQAEMLAVQLTADLAAQSTLDVTRLPEMLDEYRSKYQAIFLLDATGKELGSLLGSHWQKGPDHKRTTIDVIKPVQPPGHKQPLYVKIAEDLEPMQPFFDILRLVMSLASLAALLFSCYGIYFLTNMGLQPLHRLASHIRKMNGKDLSKRLPAPIAQDEIHDVVNAFNSLLGRLEEAMKRQQQFIADASHEFRTPLAIIEGYVTLLDRWGKDRPDIRDEAIAAMKQECNRLYSLIEELLSLAKAANGEATTNIEWQPLGPLLSEVEQAWYSVYPKQVKLSVTWVDPLMAAFDRDKLRQVFDVLLDNARKYTDVGEVNVRVFLSAETLHIHVRDTGIGIPEEDLPYVFERFYRVDKSRSRLRGGSGLGLPIAKAIIEAHRGEIDITRIDTGGTEVHVRLPQHQPKKH